MRIWVDADAAPADVREIVHRAAERLNVEARMITSEATGRDGRTGTVEGNGPSARIANQAEAGDLVITGDARLAGYLVPLGIVALDIRGAEYAGAVIEEDESVRAFVEQLRRLGGASRGPPPYDGRAKREFASALDRVLTRLRGREQI
jgi:hypothetical protein